MVIIDIIPFILINLVELSSIVLFGGFFDKKIFMPQNIIPLLLVAAVLSGANLFLWDDVCVVGFIGFAVSYLTFKTTKLKTLNLVKVLSNVTFKINWIHYSNIFVFGFILMNIVDNLIIMLVERIMYLTHNYSNEQSAMIIVIVLAVSLPTIMSLFGQGLKRINTHFPNLSHQDFQRILWVLSLIIFGMLLFLVSFLKSEQKFGTEIGVYVAMGIIMLIIVGISMFFYAKSAINKLEVEYQVEQQATLEHYVNHLEKSYLKIRRFKHDYQNILLTLNSFIEEKDLVGLQHYYSELVEASSQALAVEKGQFNNLELIQNKPIKSLLYIKLSEAQEDGIDVALEVDRPVYFGKYDFELSRMIGILMDNAIEEARQHKNAQIIVGIISSNEANQVIIRNPINPNFQLTKLTEKGFSTKGSGRGNGLATVRSIVKKHAAIRFHSQLTTVIWKRHW